MEPMIAMALILGFGIGWCVCYVVIMIDDKKWARHSKEVAEKNGKNIDIFMTHRMVEDKTTGKPMWVKDNRWKEASQDESRERTPSKDTSPTS